MICPTCGKNNAPEATTCAACGSALGSAPLTGAAVPFSPSLQTGTKLQNGLFTVGKVLGQGGFGITYKGGDMQLRRYVAIKEFFPPGCMRHAQTVQPTGVMTVADYQNVKTKFLEEARTLARFNHPGIVRVFSVFEENNTAYMVMEFLEGKTLQKLLEEKGVLPEKDAIGYIEKVGEALVAIHAANLIHRDIKPDNIIIANDGRVALIDFGTARAFAAGKTVKQTAMLTPGYAPLEQYGQHARFGVYSDIYALGATLYHCLVGQLPPQATDRATGVEMHPPDQVNPFLSREVSNAVMWAMQLKADQRPQNMKDFLSALKAPAPPRGSAQTAAPKDVDLQSPDFWHQHVDAVQTQPQQVYPPQPPAPVPSPYGYPPQSQGYPPQGYPPQSPSPGVGPPRPTNPAENSGLGEASVLPKKLQYFNWGAFLLGFFWSLAHRTWIGLVGLALAFIPGIGGFASLGFWIWLGTKGNEFAWKNRKWEDIDQFEKVQQIWFYWGIGVFVFWVIIGVITLAAAVNQPVTPSYTQ